MATYDGLIDGLGLRGWCNGSGGSGTTSMADLLARAKGGSPGAAGQEKSVWDIPFPSLNALADACPAVPRTRDLTIGLERGFLDIRDVLRVVVDPLTQPLSWMLREMLWLMTSTPWWIMIPALMLIAWVVSRSWSVAVMVGVIICTLAFVDHYTEAMQTLAIIFVCAFICVLFGVPIGIAMARNARLQRFMTPVLDMLQTLPTFVYLIPLIFLFSVTEPKLYGIAIILYAIVPVIRMTDLGIRLVDRDVIEAADAFGLTSRQKLLNVQIPLALPNIMAGVNQTIMMSLAMVVIASLVSAPGLGVLVLRGIRNLELGTGLVAGLGIVLLAILLDRVTKAALNRISSSQSGH